jgi:hypothetical protein
LPCRTEALPITEGGGRCVGVHRGSHSGYCVTEPGEAAHPVRWCRRHNFVHTVRERLNPRLRGQPDVPPDGGILCAKRCRQQFVSQPGRLPDGAGKLRIPCLPGSPTSNRQDDDRPDGESDK